MKPTVGRVVHVVSRDHNHRFVHSAAIVSKVHSDTCINAHVFNDDAIVPVLRLTSSLLDETGAGENTWHWPEREA